MSFPQIKYTAGTPGADVLIYSLYDSTSGQGQGARAFGANGAHRYVLDLKNSQAGTLKVYKGGARDTSGTPTWYQIAEITVAAAAAAASNQFEFLIEAFSDFKVEWTNGGVAQATWVVDQALTDQRAQGANVDVSGNLKVAEQFVVGWNFAHITAATTTVVKASAGVLHAIIINTIVATATITVYDNTSAAGTVIAVITLPAAGAGDMPQPLHFDVSCTTGITVVTSGATDLTVAYL